MSINIGSDVGRFKDIIKGRFKHDLKKFVSSGQLIGQQGRKVVKIPIHSIDLPIFSYGNKDRGGMGMGDGDEGDPMDGKGKPGQGKAGEDDGEHELSAEFSPEELAKIMMEYLELPLLEDKGKGKVNSEKNKYNKIGLQGPESLRHNRKTYKEALKRQISSGNYNPDNPTIIPIKEDRRYKSYSTKEAPDTNTVVMYMMDCSGSMGAEEKHIVEAEVFWIDLLLKASYKDIESIFIVHDTKAKEVSREDFFKISSGGGTRISSAYKLCSELIEKQYPFSDWNVYPFHFSDGDNFGQGDNNECADLLTEKIFPNCNVFSYGQVKSQGGSGDFIDYLGAKFADNEKITTSQIDHADDIMKSIKTFFEKGK
jgi:uncharacterized sporulation protein YeaH/YhbH (DUF444 family)